MIGILRKKYNKTTSNVFVIENGKRQGTGFYVKKFGLVSCLHNFWDIAKEVDEGELKKRLEEYYAFLPTSKNRTYSLKIKKICAKEDLIVFEMIYFNKDGGFEFARDIINVSLTNKTYIAAGYPGYSEASNQLSIVRALSVTQERELEGQKLYIVDKSFYSGASGGPVLNESGKVVGVIDRGNEYGKKEENYSAFCPVSPIWS